LSREFIDKNKKEEEFIRNINDILMYQSGRIMELNILYSINNNDYEFTM